MSIPLPASRYEKNGPALKVAICENQKSILISAEEIPASFSKNYCALFGCCFQK
jgi:hypothetical protein